MLFFFFATCCLLNHLHSEIYQIDMQMAEETEPKPWFWQIDTLVMCSDHTNVEYRQIIEVFMKNL